jgi:hypothetical protein
MRLPRDKVIADDDYKNLNDLDLYEKAKDGEAGAIEELRRRGYNV